MPGPAEYDPVRDVEALRDRLAILLSEAKKKLEEARAFVGAAQHRARICRIGAKEAAASYQRIAAQVSTGRLPN